MKTIIVVLLIMCFAGCMKVGDSRNATIDGGATMVKIARHPGYGLFVMQYEGKEYMVIRTLEGVAICPK